MTQNETTELARLRHAQSSLWQFIAAGLDIDGSHRHAMAEIDRAITTLVACRWRGQDNCPEQARRAVGRAA